MEYLFISSSTAIHNSVIGGHLTNSCDTVTGCQQHIILNHVFFRYESSGGKIRGFQRRLWSATILHRENIIQAGCD